MARYKIEISRTAEKQLKKLSKDDQKRVVAVILDLAENPLPKGSRKLAGYEDVYRIRVGHFRILYSCAARTLIVIVLKIGRRKDVYR
ncbi:MAG TPA: type II toxin-antitoxin system RelE/ParE family toxin [Vicinamibacteria bacterium]|jgi:mRNA interferase RelE/StbE|nr:type II toxin-antitoxin system RelE/ParE family toxin [Vicinamibacteria bacterium]